MARRFTDQENEFIDDIKRRQNELDWNFIANSGLNYLVKIPIQKQIETIIQLLEVISDMARTAVVAVVDDAIAYDEINIDKAVDRIKMFLRTSSMLDVMSTLLEKIANAPKDTFDLSDDERLNDILEKIRVHIIRQRNAKELRQKRRPR